MCEHEKFHAQCMYAASHVAYEYCSEYAYAIEKGLQLANLHLKKEKLAGESVNEDEANIILESVRSSAGNTISFINDEQLQVQVKEQFFHYHGEKNHNYLPEITMKSTPLERRYHQVTRKIIDGVFGEYQRIVEKGKMEALNLLNASKNSETENASKTLVSTIHECCRIFRLSLFEIRRDIESTLSPKDVEQENVRSLVVDAPEALRKSFQRDKAGTVPEKRKQLVNLATQASKKARQKSVEDSNHADMSDDDFESTEVKQAAPPILSKADKRIHSADATKVRIHPLQDTAAANTSSSSKTQTAPGPAASMSTRELKLIKSTQNTFGSKEGVLVLQHAGPSSTSSSNVKEFAIDEILEKGVKLALELFKHARPKLKALVDHFKGTGFIQILKEGLSSDAQQLIVAMINGEDISSRRLRHIHGKGTQEGVISAMMLFIASYSDRRKDTKNLSTQGTYQTFMTLSIQSQKHCISTLKNRQNASSKTLYKVLQAGETQECEKLCVPIWTLNDTLKKTILSENTADLQRNFNDKDHLLRDVAHLVRCALILICWTTQDEELKARMKKMYRHAKPFDGLNDAFPLDSYYSNGRGCKTKEAESGESRHI